MIGCGRSVSLGVGFRTVVAVALVTLSTVWWGEGWALGLAAQEVSIASAMTAKPDATGVPTARNSQDPADDPLPRAPRFKLTPPRPTSDEAITIGMSGTWPNGCTPADPRVSMVGHTITIDTFSDGPICTTVVLPWTLAVPLGKLPSGIYQVIVYNSIADDDVPVQRDEIGRTSFLVRPAGFLDAAYGLLNRRVEFDRQNFYVYRNADSGFNHGFPSGLFGSTTKLYLDAACVDDPTAANGCSTDHTRLDRARGTVLAVDFDPLSAGEFAGLHIEEPEGFSGQQGGRGYDLRPAGYLSFQARSPTGLRLRFGMGDHVTGFVSLPAGEEFQTYCIGLTGAASAVCPEGFDHLLDLNSPPDLSSVHLLFSVVTNDVNAPDGGTVLLDEIRYLLPGDRGDALGLPLSTETFGVIPLQAPDPGRVPIPPDQVNRNTAAVYEAALTLLLLLDRGGAQDLDAARLVADTLVYALNHDNRGDPLPASDGASGLHNAYESGDIAWFNTQGPAASAEGEVRLAGFSAAADLCGPSKFCLVLDGATGGNNAFAILALLSAYDRFQQPAYLDAARVIGNWIETYLLDPDSDGYGGYFLGYPDQGVVPKTVIEGKSIENNADIYAAFMALAQIERRLGDGIAADRWGTLAQRGGDFVMAMFDAASGCFYAGTVPLGTPAGQGIDPSGAQRGSEVINTYRFMDANTFTTFAMAGLAPYRQRIDWRRPVQCVLDNFGAQANIAGREYRGFGLTEGVEAGPAGVAWEFTGQAILLMQFVDALYGEDDFRESAYASLLQVFQAWSEDPFGDGSGLVAATLQDGDTLAPIEQCLSTPFQCIPQRVGLAATTWAMFADQGLNPLLSKLIDSDGDGASDHDEILRYGTAAGLADSDADGLGDGIELGISGVDSDPSTVTDPLVADSDGDGRLDGNNGSAPCEDCNNNGRLDLGESSADAFEYFVSLDEGFNLVSFPGRVPAPRSRCWTALTEPGALPDAVEAIAGLQPGSQGFEDCRDDGQGGFPLVVGAAYVFRTQAPVELPQPTGPECPMVSLQAGVNLVGVPRPPARLGCYHWLEELGRGTVESLQRFDPRTGRFESCVFAQTPSGIQPLGVDFGIRPVEGYLIGAGGSATVELPGCE